MKRTITPNRHYSAGKRRDLEEKRAKLLAEIAQLDKEALIAYKEAMKKRDLVKAMKAGELEVDKKPSEFPVNQPVPQHVPEPVPEPVHDELFRPWL